MTTAQGLRRHLGDLRSAAEVAAPASPVAARLRAACLPAIVAVSSSTVYAAYSIHAHVSYLSNSFDLGIFAQGLKGYAEGIGPISPIKGPGYSLLGDHFSPVMALLAPVYLVFPTVIVLLVAQALLLGLGAVPLVALAQRRLGRWPAVAIGVIYASSFGLASAVAYDVHEVAFAVPLIAFSLCALIEERWRAAAAWAVPLVLVKEDLGMTVAAVGVVLLLRGRRGLGAGLAAFGIAATVAETVVLIPLLNTGGIYDYSNQMTGSAFATLLHPTPDVLLAKMTSLALTLSIGCFVGVRSPILLVAVPTFLWRYIGSNPGYWGTANQYSAILMPIVVAAVLEVLIRWSDRGVARLRRVRRVLIASVALSLVVAVAFPLADMVRPSFWHVSERLPVLQAAVAEVPDGVEVAASNRLVPQLTDRAAVTVFTDRTLQSERPEWIVVDLAEDQPDTSQVRAERVQAALADGYRQVSAVDGVVVLRR